MRINWAGAGAGTVWAYKLGQHNKVCFEIKKASNDDTP